MQLERTPQPGQIWQHFKGNNYKILFVTGNSIKFLEDLYNVDASIKHHETGYECLITYANNKIALVYEHDVYTDDCLDGDYVIYQRVDPDYPQMWARPLDEFLGIIDGSSYPRFSRIS
jgi:hypothetical protein